MFPIASSVIVPAASVFELRGIGVEALHERVDVLDLGDAHMDIEFWRVVIERDGRVPWKTGAWGSGLPLGGGL
jgi:hypothetical protein